MDRRRLMTFAALTPMMLGCQPAPVSTKSHVLRIAAASNLRGIASALTDDWSRQSDAPLQWSFAASGTLVTQILAGATPDLFLSADRQYAEWLHDRFSDGGGGAAARCQPDARPFAYATGRLVWYPDAPRPRQRATPSSADAIGLSDVAIANPKTAPYGKAAWQALRSSNGDHPPWPRERIVFASDVSSVMQMIDVGAVAHGIVSASLAIAADGGDASDIAANRWIESTPADALTHYGLRLGSTHCRESELFENYLCHDAKPIFERFGYQS